MEVYGDGYMAPEEEWEREGLLDPAWEKQQKKVSEFRLLFLFFFRYLETREHFFWAERTRPTRFLKWNESCRSIFYIYFLHRFLFESTIIDLRKNVTSIRSKYT